MPPPPRAPLDSGFRRNDGVLAGMTVHPHLSAPGIPCVRFAPRPLTLCEGEVIF